MKAKEYLAQIKKLNMMIKNKGVEIEQWQELAINTSSPELGERVCSSGAQDTMANAIVNYVDMETDVYSQKQALIDKRNEIIRTIEQIPEQEYDVLHLRYVQFLTLDEVADVKDKSYTWVTTVHGRGLASVQRILDEREKKV